MKFYLCRHGQTHWNVVRKLQGHLESELTDLGIQQANELARKAKQWHIHFGVSSHLSRAAQTAKICAQQLNIKHDTYKQLAERNFGEWQGNQITTIKNFDAFRQHCYDRLDETPNSSGESTNTVRLRFMTVLKTIAQNADAESNVLVVSHADAIDCVISQWTHPQY